MSNLKQLAREKVHTRDIIISTYKAGENAVIVEGRLIDNRTDGFYLLSGDKTLPGTIHNLIIRLLIEGPQLLIKDVEVEMQKIPREECNETKKCLDILKGMNIASGFTLKIKSLIGGVNGCAHLESLLIAMAPAAFQGYWACIHREKSKVESLKNSTKMTNGAINTCWVWREDGPLAARYKKMMNIS